MLPLCRVAGASKSLGRHKHTALHRGHERQVPNALWTDPRECHIVRPVPARCGLGKALRNVLDGGDQARALVLGRCLEVTGLRQQDHVGDAVLGNYDETLRNTQGLGAIGRRLGHRVSRVCQYNTGIGDDEDITLDEGGNAFRAFYRIGIPRGHGHA